MAEQDLRRRRADRAPWSRWTNAELDVLQRLAPQLTAPEVSKRLGKTVEQVRGKAARAGIAFSRARGAAVAAKARWSQHDALSSKSDGAILAALFAIQEGRCEMTVRLEFGLSEDQYRLARALSDEGDDLKDD